MDTKLKYKVDKISTSSDSSSKSINRLQIYVDSANKAADTTIRKLVYLSNK